MVIDYVGPPTFSTSLALLRKGGKLLLLGQLAGRETTFNIHQTYLKHLSIHGLYLGRKEELEAVLGLVAEGDLRPVIHAELPLRRAADAQRLVMESRHVGKVVMTP